MTRVNTAILVAVLIGTVSASTSAETVKVWKWIDADGNVVYSADPPPSQVTKVEEKNFDPNQNVIEMPVPLPSPTASQSKNYDTPADRYPPTSNQPTLRYTWPGLYQMPPQPLVSAPSTLRSPAPSSPTPRMR